MKIEIKIQYIIIFLISLILLIGCSDSSSNSITGTSDITPIDSTYVPYRYLESEGIYMYYETANIEVYRNLLPSIFELPERLLVYSFIIDFYKLDFGATPYRENSVFILGNYQGEEVWHCVYMPVSDERAMWAGIIGLGLPKTLGDIQLFRNNPIYEGHGVGLLGSEMTLAVDTSNNNILEEDKNTIEELSQLRILNILNGRIIAMSSTAGQDNNIFNVAEMFPEYLTIKFGSGSMTTNTAEISADHPLDLAPSRIIGTYYMQNKIPFSLTGSPF